MQADALSFLEGERERLAQLLREIKLGRQLLSGYRSQSKPKHRLFDIRG